jgi:hypothetical protein
MNELYEEIKKAFQKYNNKRFMASEILDVDGMEEAIIDELENRGFKITEES